MVNPQRDKYLSEVQSDVTICALHLTHPRCTHTAVNTHTVNTHPKQWAAIYAAAPSRAEGLIAFAIILRYEKMRFLQRLRLYCQVRVMYDNRMISKFGERKH